MIVMPFPSLTQISVALFALGPRALVPCRGPSVHAEAKRWRSSVSVQASLQEQEPPHSASEDDLQAAPASQPQQLSAPAPAASTAPVPPGTALPPTSSPSPTAASPAPLMPRPRFSELDRLSGASLPQHVAVIMDGNARWARAAKLPKAAGHAAGVEALRRLVQGCLSLEAIQVLTVYAFSIENWGRPTSEVDMLLELIQRVIVKEAEPLRQLGVQLRFIGELERMPSELQRILRDVSEPQLQERRLLLCIALSYGGRQELARAARALAGRVATGDLPLSALDETALATELYSSSTSVPSDPDVLIRTGGQQRLSNFLLYQSAYTELITLDCLWPDFTVSELAHALRAYALRSRTFGTRHSGKVDDAEA